jgi:hypothetical protein
MLPFARRFNRLKHEIRLYNIEKFGFYLKENTASPLQRPIG